MKFYAAGGVRVRGDFLYDNPILKRTLNAEQITLLEELKSQVSGKKLGILNSVLV